MRTISLFIFIIFFLIFPNTISALDIQEGYWVGMRIDSEKNPNRSGQFEKLEEWYFGENKLTTKIYQQSNYYQLRWYSIDDGSYELKNNILSVNNHETDKTTSYPVSFKNEVLLIEFPDKSTIYLYYNGLEASIPDDSPLGIHFENRSFSVDLPQHFFDTKEIEFWDFTSFYNADNLTTCHHEYKVIRFGKYDFIEFEYLGYFRIIQQENEDFFIEQLSESGLKKIGFRKINSSLSTLSSEDLIGSWKWKETKKKPKHQDNVYTISIGYDVHKLVIDDSLNIQWLTKIYQESLFENETDFIPDGIKDFQSRHLRKRKENEVPNIRFSPSKNLMIFESYSTSSIIQNKDEIYSRIMVLQLVEKFENKLIFKVPYLKGNYITLTRINID